MRHRGECEGVWAISVPDPQGFSDFVEGETEKESVVGKGDGD